MKAAKGNAHIIYQCIYDTLNGNNNMLDVTLLCALGGVSRSGYYAWLASADKRQAKEDKDLEDFKMVLEAYKTRGYSKGTRQLKMLLDRKDPSQPWSRKKISRLMHQFKLFCPIRKENPYRKFMKELQAGTVAANTLNREFCMYGPRAVLLTDVTYLPYDGGTAYLSAILDAYTREILAYVVSDTMEEDFVLETIHQLVAKHKISLSEQTVIHSDQGCQYTSRRFIDLVHDSGLRRSMSRKATCWDNAPMESFWGHMKDHIGKSIKACTNVEAVRAIVDDYIEYYNNECPQWGLAHLCPSEFHTFCVTGVYPLAVPNPPEAPKAQLTLDELGKPHNKSSENEKDPEISKNTSTDHPDKSES